MAISGSKLKAYVNGFELQGYLNSLGASLQVDALESTVFGNEDKTFVPGRKTATLTGDGFYDADTTGLTLDRIDDVLGAALGGAAIWTVLPAGDTFGDAGYAMDTFSTKYEIKDDSEKLTTVAIESQSKTAKDRVEVLHAMAQETVDANGTDLNDVNADTTKGAVAVLQVEAVNGGSLAAKVQHSSDGVTWVDLVSFSAHNARAAERVAIAGTVHQHLRAVWALSGGDATFNVAISRK